MSIIMIDEYLKTLDESGAEYVNDFISFMHQNYPQLTPKISFSMPMWLAGKKMNEGYVAISTAKAHFSIHFSDERYIMELKKKLPKCKTGKQCINIKYGDEEAYRIVKEHVLAHFHF